jgi:hypothetical protein
MKMLMMMKDERRGWTKRVKGSETVPFESVQRSAVQQQQCKFERIRRGYRMVQQRVHLCLVRLMIGSFIPRNENLNSMLSIAFVKLDRAVMEASQKAVVEYQRT